MRPGSRHYRLLSFAPRLPEVHIWGMPDNMTYRPKRANRITCRAQSAGSRQSRPLPYSATPVVLSIGSWARGDLMRTVASSARSRASLTMSSMYVKFLVTPQPSRGYMLQCGRPALGLCVGIGNDRCSVPRRTAFVISCDNPLDRPPVLVLWLYRQYPLGHAEMI